MSEGQEIKIQATAGIPMDFTKRRVVIAYPSSDLVSVHFNECLTNLITQNSRFVPLGLTNATSSRITANRNIIVQNARQLGGTDLLYVDSDSVFPPHALMQLLTHDKDIACATTCRRKGNDRSPICTPLDFDSIEPFQKLVQMKAIGFPFMLIKMSVFDRLDEMGLAPDGVYFAEPPRQIMKDRGWDCPGMETLIPEDEYWCHLVRQAGFDIWCDMELSMQIGHVGLDVVYIENNPHDMPKANVDESL